MIKDYTLIFAKTIKNNHIVNFNKMTIFLKKFFGFEIKSKVSRNKNEDLNDNKKDLLNNNEELLNDNQNLLNSSLSNDNYDKDYEIEKKINKYGIPTNIKSGLMNYENYDEESFKLKVSSYLIINIILENFNKYFDKKCDDTIMIMKTEEYNKIIDSMINNKNNNLLKLPKIDNINSILGLNNILTFKIDENVFNSNKSIVVNKLLNLLQENKLIKLNQ